MTTTLAIGYRLSSQQLAIRRPRQTGNSFEGERNLSPIESIGQSLRQARNHEFFSHQFSSERSGLVIQKNSALLYPRYRVDHRFDLFTEETDAIDFQPILVATCQDQELLPVQVSHIASWIAVV